MNKRPRHSKEVDSGTTPGTPTDQSQRTNELEREVREPSVMSRLRSKFSASGKRIIATTAT